jgi:hypothetical protein
MQRSTLLTPQDPVLLLVDPQPGLAFVVESQSRAALRNNLTALAKTAVAFSVPEHGGAYGIGLDYAAAMLR